MPSGAVLVKIPCGERSKIEYFAGNADVDNVPQFSPIRRRNNCAKKVTFLPKELPTQLFFTAGLSDRQFNF
jgi:hypothetical protein